MSDLMRCQLIGGALGVLLAALLWFGPHWETAGTMVGWVCILGSIVVAFVRQERRFRSNPVERWRQAQNVRALARAAEEDAVIAEFNKNFGPGIVRVETAHDPHHFWYAVTFDDGTTKRWYPGAMRLVHD
jgi:hypothetical protein